MIQKCADTLKCLRIALEMITVSYAGVPDHRQRPRPSSALGLRLNTIRNHVTHMNYRLALRFPHRKHYIGLRWGPRRYWMVNFEDALGRRLRLQPSNTMLSKSSYLRPDPSGR